MLQESDKGCILNRWTHDHVHLNPKSLMRGYLARDVMSREVAVRVSLGLLRGLSSFDRVDSLPCSAVLLLLCSAASVLLLSGVELPGLEGSEARQNLLEQSLVASPTH